MAALEASSQQAAQLTEEQNTGRAEQQSADSQEAVGEVRYSLMAFEDGRRFVEVDTDQEQFDGLTDREKLDLAERIIRDRFVGRVIGKENKVFINAGGAREYAHPAKAVHGAELDAKARVATELDNVMDAGFNFRVEPDGRDGHNHPGVHQFEYFDAIFKVGGEFYQGTVNVGDNMKGRLFKDITKIRSITESIYGSYGENPTTVSLSNASEGNIPHPAAKSNPQNEDGQAQYSIKGSERAGELAELERENKRLKEQAEYWFKQAHLTTEVVDGKVRYVYKADAKAVQAEAKRILEITGSKLTLNKVTAAFPTALRAEAGS